MVVANQGGSLYAGMAVRILKKNFQKWLTLVRNQWLTFIQNAWLTLVRNGWLSLVQNSQVDPLAHMDHSVSPYAYAGNNPLMFNDPLGDVKVTKEIVPYSPNAGWGAVALGHVYSIVYGSSLSFWQSLGRADPYWDSFMISPYDFKAKYGVTRAEYRKGAKWNPHGGEQIDYDFIYSGLERSIGRDTEELSEEIRDLLIKKNVKLEPDSGNIIHMRTWLLTVCEGKSELIREPAVSDLFYIPCRDVFLRDTLRNE